MQRIYSLSLFLAIALTLGMNVQASEASGAGAADFKKAAEKRLERLEEGFLDAVAHEGLEVVKKLFLQPGLKGTKVDAADHDALMIACIQGNAAMAKWLLEECPSREMFKREINRKDREGLSALMHVLGTEIPCDNQYALVKLLLDHDADANTDDNDALTALIVSGHETIDRLLFEYGADIDHPFADGETALMKAVRECDFDHVEAIIDLGANVKLTNKDGQTALVIAKSLYDQNDPDVHEEIIQLLENVGSPKLSGVDAREHKGKGVQVSFQNVNDYPDARPKLTGFSDDRILADWGLTEATMHKAGENGALAALIMSGKTALVKQILTRHEELIKSGQTGVNVDGKSVYGFTPLMCAADKGDKEIVELLLKNGANVDSAYVPFKVPSTEKDAPAMRRKLEKERGKTAYIFAQDKNDQAIMKLLHDAMKQKAAKNASVSLKSENKEQASSKSAPKKGSKAKKARQKALKKEAQAKREQEQARLDALQKQRELQAAQEKQRLKELDEKQERFVQQIARENEQKRIRQQEQERASVLRSDAQRIESLKEQAKATKLHTENIQKQLEQRGKESQERSLMKSEDEKGLEKQKLENERIAAQQKERKAQADALLENLLVESVKEQATELVNHELEAARVQKEQEKAAAVKALEQERMDRERKQQEELVTQLKVQEERQNKLAQEQEVGRINLARLGLMSLTAGGQAVDASKGTQCYVCSKPLSGAAISYPCSKHQALIHPACTPMQGVGCIPCAREKASASGITVAQVREEHKTDPAKKRQHFVRKLGLIQPVATKHAAPPAIKVASSDHSSEQPDAQPATVLYDPRAEQLKREQDHERRIAAQQNIILTAIIGKVDKLKECVTNAHQANDVSLGNSALHAAAMSGHKDAVEYLLKCGGDPAIANKEGSTAFDLAQRHPQIMALEPFATMQREQLEAQRKKEEELYNMHVSPQGHLLLETCDTLDEAIIWAVKIAEKLTGVRTEADKKNIALQVMREWIFEAAERGNQAEVTRCLRAGADINRKSDRFGTDTALLVATKVGNSDIIEQLLEQRADVTISNDKGDTPLLRASRCVTSPESIRPVELLQREILAKGSPKDIAEANTILMSAFKTVAMRALRQNKTPATPSSASSATPSPYTIGSPVAFVHPLIPGSSNSSTFGSQSPLTSPLSGSRSTPPSAITQAGTP